MKKTKLAYVMATILAFSSCKQAINVEPIIEQEMIADYFVGSNVPAYVEGTGSRAGFEYPSSIVSDNSGNLFVAEPVGGRIRKVTSEGTTSTIAGGVVGYQDGTGASARFSDGENALTIDGQNNLYLADHKNRCIRKITPNGVVTTVVGHPTRNNSIDGPVATAGISFPGLPDITMDASNNIYFLDTKGIRKVSADGIVSTIFPTSSFTKYGPIATAAIANPTTITTDKKGNLYVASRTPGRSVIIKVGVDGIVSEYAGGTNGYNYDAAANAARFGDILNITSDNAGNLYLANATTKTYLKIAVDGFTTLVAGRYTSNDVTSFTPGLAPEVAFIDVRDIISSPNGVIYLVEQIAGSIRKVSLVDKPTPTTQTEIDKANWNKPTNWK